jgi:hypothetical protein
MGVGGKTLYVLVGGQNGYNGGGTFGYTGGGATDIRSKSDDLSTRLVVAGGGGGQGIRQGSIVVNGGAGGGLTGVIGNKSATGTNGGGGATQTAGGTSTSGRPGLLGIGGNGYSQSGSGVLAYAGSGGGGYYGGGVGNIYYATGTDIYGAGGGGGSSYIDLLDSTTSVTTAGLNSGNGSIVITFVSHDKFLLKQGSKFYSILPAYYDEINTHNFIPLSLEGGDNPNANDIANFGFDEPQQLTTMITKGSDAFLPIDKIKAMGGAFDLRCYYYNESTV